MRIAWALSTAAATIVLAAALVLTGPGARAEDGSQVPLDLAVMETPVGTTLDDILSGRAQPGFTPVLTPGTPFTAREGQVLWVRIRAELPEAPRDWRLGIVRVPVDQVRLRVHPPGEIVARDGFFRRDDGQRPWPARFDLPLPEGLAGRTELYLEIEGQVMGGLHLSLRDGPAAVAEEAQARFWFRLVYGLLLAVALLSLVRHAEDSDAGAPAVGAAAFCAWLACLGINGHLYSLPEVALLSGLGAVVPQALFLLGAGPLVLATLRYSGLAKSAPPLVGWMRGLGWLLVAGAVFAFTLPPGASITLQWVAWFSYPVALMACLVMLAMDSRSYRWAPLLTLLAMAAAVLVRVLADNQVLEAGWWTLYGWQLLLALVVTQFLALPWGRARLQRWQVRRRAMPPEPSAEEKIAVARDKLVKSLQLGLAHADDDDMSWIAYRRLLDGLKSVLPQDSSAVVGEHADGEELLQVEPKSAEPRYRDLLRDRTTLLRNLSKLKAPQQVGLDFDGPDGPLEKVQLAVIPLPIPRPGWGALLVERPDGVAYSDAELALCAEFAAMAVMAGEEASGTVSAQRQAETDPATGVFREESLRERLQQMVDAARLKQSPFSLLCVVVDQLPALRQASGEVGAVSALRPVAMMLRDELSHGDLVGRGGPDGFLVLAPGKKLLQAREYADRLREAVSHMVVDPRIAPMLTISVGIAQAGPDERNIAALTERAAKAALVASKNGGNQIFS
ncbi:GGDEF domain-containing protein [Arenimonas sp.]|uniref:GGDEF domain-containing protein n=1 Tax=Arenimonas sp. TaxID=1872635 RepID=UPI0025EBA510|nr:GGDEF domain-containing protein [Arenimonas sp.]